MLLGEPPATQFDLHFQIAGIPVRVHPLFWLAGLVLGAGGRTNGVMLLTWMSVFFVSILVHELGHSLMMRRFGMSSHIVLHMLGGLAIPDSAGFGRRGSSARQWVLISFAGPAAGFALAGCVVLLILGSGGSFEVGFDRFPPWDYRLEPPFESPPFQALVWYLLIVNIFWGLINLAPVYPLDGGQIARHLFMEKDPWQGVVKSLWLSVFTGGAVAAFGLTMGRDGLFMAILFGMLAVQSYLAIQQSGGGGFGRRRPW